MTMTIDFQQDQDYVRFCRGELSNPYPLYQRLREREPIHWCEGFQGWLLTRYSDVLSALKDSRLSSGGRLASYMDQLPQTVAAQVHPLRAFYSTWLVNLDPPDHTRIRSLVSKAFTPKVVDNLRSFIVETCDSLIEPAMAQGSMEFVSGFARPLPARVISKMLGITNSRESESFEGWSAVLSDFTGTGRPIAEKAIDAEQAMESITAFIRNLIEDRRRQPMADLISAFAAVEDGGERLTEGELVGLSVFLLVAGHETTMALLSNGLLALMNDARQLQLLKTNPSLITSAVEEFLRFESPLQHQVRTAQQDLTIDGVHISKGQRVVVFLGAANRDPAQFDEPDQLDIARKPNPHLAFGLGIHYCIGAPLARLEGQIAFEILIRRLRNIRLSDPDIRWRRHTSQRNPSELRVQFDSKDN